VLPARDCSRQLGSGAFPDWDEDPTARAERGPDSGQRRDHRVLRHEVRRQIGEVEHLPVGQRHHVLTTQHDPIGEPMLDHPGAGRREYVVEDIDADHAKRRRGLSERDGDFAHPCSDIQRNSARGRQPLSQIAKARSQHPDEHPTRQAAPPTQSRLRAQVLLGPIESTLGGGRRPPQRCNEPRRVRVTPRRGHRGRCRIQPPPADSRSCQTEYTEDPALPILQDHTLVVLLERRGECGKRPRRLGESSNKPGEIALMVPAADGHRTSCPIRFAPGPLLVTPALIESAAPPGSAWPGQRGIWPSSTSG
jgi:hypothetical protein